MSELETLLKKHTDDVGKALGEFKGKVDTIDGLITALAKRADELEAKGNRLALGSGANDDGKETNAFVISDAERKYMGAAMKGQPLPELERKATSSMQVATEGDGGILVPDQIRGTMEMLIKRQSPIRRVARVVPLGASDKFPVSGTGATAGWVGENDNRDQTSTPTIEGVQLPGGTLYALPQASEEIIDDAILNLESFLTDQVIDVMGETESIAFIRGDGSKKPAGFLNAPQATTADGTRKLGTLQYIPTGDANGFGANSMIDALVSLLMSTKAGYRQAPGCAYLASTDFLSSLAKIKDGQGRPIYIPSPADGVPGSILGYPAVECEHMDAVAADGFPVAFGNWQRGYVIGDRTQLNVLRDPYTTKGVVKWYFRRRVHGAVLNSEAIKLLKVGVN